MNAMVSASPLPMAQPPRSNPFRRSSSDAPPFPCTTPSTVICVVVVSFIGSSSRRLGRKTAPGRGSHRSSVGAVDHPVGSRGMSGRRKLVVFVPKEALEADPEAVFAAGAGRIGNYERCSGHVLGTGNFRGGEGSSPSVGAPGRDERVQEARLETVYPVELEADVVRALRAAHPYEEPAFDLYPLLDPPADTAFVAPAGVE